ncbi:two-component system alkaline phosphatase synthesis response regulator PhoP [Balneicella halophila]|uniref:Phosphate regulon transcriptional regulatory protein PhoB n=1 Tax=Balneicella halophila TaxID=1537566 RepID=A0A7L4URB2_BALHA|nr:response regulator transcription factor [Balneicella halophila]PVX52052.1 two-component system alkaline phosphatase synthesis response regulator PhoP [Balneicella halophila]
MEKRILIVDDEKDILEFLSYNLKKEGYKVVTAQNGVKAIKEARKFKPHIIVLDVMMPIMDGYETCRQLRQYVELKESIIIFLTAKSEEYSEIEGFESGADDYITKPIKPKSFISRINAFMRRIDLGKDSEVITTKDMIIDREKYHVKKDGQTIILPRKEFEILSLLASTPQQVFSRSDIFKNVWDNNIVVGDRTIDVHIRKLREKIGEDYIKTVKGVGYKFEE